MPSKTRGRDSNEQERELLEIQVCADVELDPTSTTKKIAEELNFSKSLIHKMLVKHGYQCYKLRSHQELFPGDYFRRMSFCEEIIEMSNSYPQFISNILFAD